MYSLLFRLHVLLYLQLHAGFLSSYRAATLLLSISCGAK